MRIFADYILVLLIQNSIRAHPPNPRLSVFYQSFSPNLARGRLSCLPWQFLPKLMSQSTRRPAR